MFAPKPRQPQQAIVNRKLHAKRATQRIATEPRRECKLCHRRCVQGFLRIASVQKMNWSDQRNRPMFRHLVTTMWEANQDMMFITEVRSHNWLDGKNLHIVCGGIRFRDSRTVLAFFESGCLQALGSLRMHLDLGWRGRAMVGFAHGDRWSLIQPCGLSPLHSEHAHGNTDSISLLL